MDVNINFILAEFPLSEVGNQWLIPQAFSTERNIDFAGEWLKTENKIMPLVLLGQPIQAKLMSKVVNLIDSELFQWFTSSITP
ncbi:hypothetical protein [Planktothrix sp.]|uniref:hypothetical protein n=1 Tax=Planktothrix sp. TaxID=3088171 RepID=UPI0038D51610